jgi:hypothetical protein
VNSQRKVNLISIYSQFIKLSYTFCHLLKAVELRILGIDVVLIDLVSQQEEMLLVGESDDSLDVLSAQHLRREF